MPRYVVETALILGVVVFVGQQLLTGQLATGLATLGVFLAGAVRIMGAILPLQTAVAALKVNTEQSALARELLRELRTPPSDSAPPTPQANAAPPRHKALGVELHSVSYRYPGAEDDVLRDALQALAEEKEDLEAIQEAIRELEAGVPGPPIDEAFARIRAKHQIPADA